MTLIGLHGGGNMVEAIFRQAEGREDIQVAAIISRSPVPWSGDTPQYPSLENLAADIDVLIDFTLPDGLQSAARWCAKNRTPLLSGTTGLDEQQQGCLPEAARSVAVLHSANLSLGMGLLQRLVEEAARVLGDTADITIEDVHHIHKKDAPSGTALMLGGAIAEFCPHGDITYNSKREGEVIGRHVVRFSLADEQIELSHTAENRSIYATGALHAALWLANQKPGFYTNIDYLDSNR